MFVSFFRYQCCILHLGLWDIFEPCERFSFPCLNYDGRVVINSTHKLETGNSDKSHMTWHINAAASLWLTCGYSQICLRVSRLNSLRTEKEKSWASMKYFDSCFVLASINCTAKSKLYMHTVGPTFTVLQPVQTALLFSWRWNSNQVWSWCFGQNGSTDTLTYCSFIHQCKHNTWSK